MNNKWIWVTFRKEGIHKFPTASGMSEDIRFLEYPHRHIFHFKVWISVSHSDRDIEFILFKRWLESLYKDDVLSLDYKSCEMMSDDLYNKIHAEYPFRNVKIEVSEDGENGCLVEYLNYTNEN